MFDCFGRGGTLVLNVDDFVCVCVCACVCVCVCGVCDVNARHLRMECNTMQWGWNAMRCNGGVTDGLISPM
jgi:hypothetical protein